MNNVNKTPSNGEAIEKSLDNYEEPDSLAEATTVPLDDNALGDHATEKDIDKK